MPEMIQDIKIKHFTAKPISTGMLRDWFLTISAPVNWLRLHSQRYFGESMTL